jgi:hypothetical protein
MFDGFDVAVIPVARGRLAIILLEPNSWRLNHRDDADDHEGYTIAEVCPILEERYGMSQSEAEERVNAALSLDIEDRIAAALAKTAGT